MRMALFISTRRKRDMSSKTRHILVFTLAGAFFLGSCSELSKDQIDGDHLAPPELDFEYISVSGGRIHTLHELKYVVSTAADLQVTEPKSRIAQFNGTPYRISLAAFISDTGSLMIHAEEVADSSGASNYSHLPSAIWPNESFRSSGPQCIQIPAEEVEEEHDLLWLRQNGFEPSGSIIYAQYFATTADMNSELVISILHRVTSCDEASADSEIIREFQAKTLVTRLE
jgi:hypothetical protein